MDKESCIAFCGDKEILVIDVESSQRLSIPIIDQLKNEKQTDPNHSCSGHILVVGVSKTGTFIGAVNDAKHVFVYNIKDFANPCLISESIIQRRGACITFSMKEDFVLVADKSGDVYSIPTTPQREPVEPQLILGHVSMLTDLQISPSGCLLATADRDEKVRLSRYPNCYNIYSFLLGHQSFVTRVVFSSNGEFLYTAGGDGNLLLWDISSSRCILDCDVKQYIADDSVQEAIVNSLHLVGDKKLYLTLEGCNFVLILAVDFENQKVSMSSKVDCCDAVKDSFVVTISDRKYLLLFTDSRESILKLIDIEGNDEIVSGNSFLNDVNKQEYERLKFALAQAVRFQSLKKCPVDKTGLELYKERKEQTQKNVLARRLRHKHRTNKKAKVSDGENGDCPENVDEKVN